MLPERKKNTLNDLQGILYSPASNIICQPEKSNDSYIGCRVQVAVQYTPSTASTMSTLSTVLRAALFKEPGGEVSFATVWQQDDDSLAGEFLPLADF